MGQVSAQEEKDIDNDFSSLTKSTSYGRGTSDKKQRENLDGKARVIHKIKSNPHYAEITKNIGALNRFADCLSDPQMMKQTYLSPDWTITLALQDKNLKVEQEIKKLKEKGAINGVKKQTKHTKTVSVTDALVNVTTMKSESRGNEENIDIEEEDEEEDPQKLIEQWKKYSLDPNAQLDKKLKIKLIITDIHANSKVKKSLRSLMSPILTSVNMMPEFGMFHTGLVIGPWKIEWNDSALCVPRKVVARAALLTADIDCIATIKEFKDVVDKLANVICHWNKNMEYKDRGGDDKGGNCQDFCTAVLQAIGVKVKFSPIVENFLQEMRRHGKCSMMFEMDATFREEFNKKEKKVEFKTHEQLDDFVLSLGPDFQENYPHEYIMLKSFDRAFWMRHYKFPDNEKYKPKEEKITSPIVNNSKESTITKCKCPFGDPEMSRSLLFKESTK